MFLLFYEMETESFILNLIAAFLFCLGKLGIYHFAMLLVRVAFLFSSLQQERIGRSFRREKGWGWDSILLETVISSLEGKKR